MARYSLLRLQKVLLFQSCLDHNLSSYAADVVLLRLEESEDETLQWNVVQECNHVCKALTAEI
jgi:hypothetical protein